MLALLCACEKLMTVNEWHWSRLATPLRRVCSIQWNQTKGIIMCTSVWCSRCSTELLYRAELTERSEVMYERKLICFNVELSRCFWCTKHNTLFLLFHLFIPMCVCARDLIQSNTHDAYPELTCCAHKHINVSRLRMRRANRRARLRRHNKENY